MKCPDKFGDKKSDKDTNELKYSHVMTAMNRQIC